MILSDIRYNTASINTASINTESFNTESINTESINNESINTFKNHVHMLTLVSSRPIRIIFATNWESYNTDNIRSKISLLTMSNMR